MESMARKALVLASCLILLSQSSAAPASEDPAVDCDSEGLIYPQNITRVSSRGEAALCRSKRCLDRDMIDCSVEEWIAPGKAFVLCDSSFIPQGYFLSSTSLNCTINHGCVVKDTCAVRYELKKVRKGRKRRQDKISRDGSEIGFLVFVIIFVVACLGCIWLVRK